MEDIASKLLASTSVKGLIGERDLAGAVAAAGWLTAHSWYYSDPQTLKLRESDVLGIRQWETRKRPRLSVNVHLLAEVKSLSGFHIVFSPLSGRHLLKGCQDEWFGREGENRDVVAATIGSATDDPNFAQHTLELFGRKAYPHHTAVNSRLLAEPMAAPHYSSSFRETNVGTEKDIDNSVLWRAMQSLRSAIAALRSAYIDDRRSDFAINLRVASESRARDDQQYAVNSAIEFAHIYHPLVVVDAPLWVIKEGGLERTNWLRFEQTGRFVNPEWWCDIVHSSAATEYISFVTHHYERHYRQRRAPSREMTGFRASP